MDDAEVFRDPEWRSMSPGQATGYYQCSVLSLGAYTNGASDEFYSPMIAVENTPTDYLHVWVRYNIPSPDYGRIYAYDLAAGTWSPLGSVQGSQSTWTHLVYNMSAYLNKNIVVALWLDSTLSTKEATGWWDVDAVHFSHEPTSVKLKRFEAWPEGAAMHVQWETSEEIDNLGFNLYRSGTRNGPKRQLNRELIPTKVPPGSPFGAVYEWIDAKVKPGHTCFYWLEDVDLYGNATLHRPVKVKMP